MKITQYDYDRLMDVFDIHIERYKNMKKELDNSIEATRALKEKFIEIKECIVKPDNDSFKFNPRESAKKSGKYKE